MDRTRLIHNLRKLFATGATLAALIAAGIGTSADAASAQTRNVFQPGEELVYDVKFGFITLGKMIIQTGNETSNGVSARMQFATANVPFLNSKGDIRDVINTRTMSLANSDVKWTNGSNVSQKTLAYDPSAKTLDYSDGKTSDVTQNVDPFNDILSLVYNMRTWSGSGKSYYFPIRTSDGVHKVVCNFTTQTANESVAALGDKEVATRVLQGHADMGSSSPLGANGDFTAYISDDAAAVPVKINMKIGIGSITLDLAKVKSQDWAAAK